MPLLVNLRHLEEDNLELKGELPATDLELDLRDNLIRTEKPLGYDFEVQRLDNSLLLHGKLHLPLACQCVRCLKEFNYDLILDDWTVHLPLEGEEKVPISGDFVDLTPHIREDILLEFPQHPLCEADCRGLPKTDSGKSNTSDSTKMDEPSPWAELDKLKLK
ncbi:MAG TPA: YceD family protein [Candidatus Paceibacterota bacterium]|nr:YceD family protein [Candidatus Paceibacterota bacterium]